MPCPIKFEAPLSLILNATILCGINSKFSFPIHSVFGSPLNVLSLRGFPCHFSGLSVLLLGGSPIPFGGPSSQSFPFPFPFWGLPPSQPFLRALSICYPGEEGKGASKALPSPPSAAAILGPRTARTGPFAGPRSCAAPQLHGPAGLGRVGPATVRLPGLQTKVCHLGFAWPRSWTGPQLDGPAGLGCVGPAAVRSRSCTPKCCKGCSVPAPEASTCCRVYNFPTLGPQVLTGLFSDPGPPKRCRSCISNVSTLKL